MTSEPIFLTLQAKKQLTHDVYELEYISENPLNILPGQFLLCDTAGDPKLRRSYSVSWAGGNHVSFIIKRLPEGKGGSVAICDQNVGHTMQAWGPLGHFTLRDTPFPKVFIGTGTGFAPLYFMMKKLQTTNCKLQIMFLFGVRELRDVFYTEELQNWSRGDNFDYEIYCSRESASLPEKHNLGRITDYITPFLKGERNSEENKGDFIYNKSSVSPVARQLLQKGAHTEFYICGSPAMVTEVRSMLGLYGISSEKVFFEQY